MVYTPADKVLVYVAWGNAGDCVYVGRSFVGLRRFARHEALEVNSKGIEVIELNWCDTRQQAIDLEKQLIRKYEPMANKVRYSLREPKARRNARFVNPKTYLLKLDSGLYEEWRRAAKERGLTVSEFIRSSVNEALKAQRENENISAQAR